jgi:hypothetical protein
LAWSSSCIIETQNRIQYTRLSDSNGHASSTRRLRLCANSQPTLSTQRATRAQQQRNGPGAREGPLVALQRPPCTPEPSDMTRSGAHNCAGISRPAAYLLGCRARAIRLPFLEPSDRSLHIREWRFSTATHCFWNAACGLSRCNIPISGQTMDPPSISARVADCLCDTRKGHAGTAWAARGRGRKSVPSIPERLEWHVG